MVKTELLGAKDYARNNPVLTHTADLMNGSLLVKDGVTYLIDNVLTGDDSYRDGVMLKAGEFLNGYDVASWAGQCLIADEEHFNFGARTNYAGVQVNDVFKAGDDGKFEYTASAPTEGVYFVCVEKTALTEKALKVRIVVVDKTSA